MTTRTALISVFGEVVFMCYIILLTPSKQFTQSDSSSSDFEIYKHRDVAE
jgi:hypothetical protein